MVNSLGQSWSLSRGDGEGCVSVGCFRTLLWQISEMTLDHFISLFIFFPPLVCLFWSMFLGPLSAFAQVIVFSVDVTLMGKRGWKKRFIPSDEIVQ